MREFNPRDDNGQPLAPEVIAKEIKRFRKHLGLTQKAFAEEFAVSLGTLRDWEQGNRKRSLASQVFVRHAVGQLEADKAANKSAEKTEKSERLTLG